MLQCYKSLLHYHKTTFELRCTFGKQTETKMADKKKYNYEGKLQKMPSQKILININHLEKGEYELNIIHKNKVLKKTNFKKK